MKLPVIIEDPARIDRFPFAIFYRPDDSALRVFAVLHTSREPGSWQSRGH